MSPMRSLQHQPEGQDGTQLPALSQAPDAGAPTGRQLQPWAAPGPVEEQGEFDGMRRKITLGAFTILLVFGGLGTWAATASIDGAIVAPGRVQVESGRKAVQHLEGGIVKEILVRDGDTVKEGDVLIRLRDKVTSANLRAVQGQVAELAIRRERLLAEREGKDTFYLPSNLRIGKDDRALNQILDGQKALLASRRDSRRAEIGLLRQQQAQLRSQIAGMKAQDASKARQIQFFEDELKEVRGLAEKGQVPKSKLLTLERDAETNRGEKAALAASIAASDMKISELELQILRLDTTTQEKVAEELRAVEAEMNTASQRLITSEDQADRTAIRSPRTGKVYKLAVHTPGAVIKAGEPLMEIVPDDDALIIVAQVAPADIDKVAAGQSAVVRLSAFNQRSTPHLEATVAVISSDIITDPAGRSYYQANITIPPKQMALLEGLQLKPGMPAETMIRTGTRSPFSYFWKPVSDSFSRAMKEE